MEELLLKTYRNMPADDKLIALKMALYSDMPPLRILFAIAIILEPDNVIEVYKRLESILKETSSV
jgi:hypothetical protein